MSRVGKQPIALPKGVKVEIKGQVVAIEGPKGRLEREIRREVLVKLENNQLLLSTAQEDRKARAYHGMERALLNNMVVGVSSGFIRELDVVGVGYRAEAKGNILNLGLGYSHPIDFELPTGIKGVVVKEGREITIRLEGIDRQLVGQTAARIRKLRPPEVYKGKGVRYKGEQIKLKESKKVKK